MCKTSLLIVGQRNTMGVYDGCLLNSFGARIELVCRSFICVQKKQDHLLENVIAEEAE
jgi:hypothetical protein